MAKRKLIAYRPKIVTPARWALRQNRKAVFHRIEVVGEAETPDGVAMVVKLAQNVELSNPDFDVAAMVGKVVTYRDNGTVNPHSPELWFWDNRFWLKAIDKKGIVYYNNHTYLIYPIEVERAEELVAAIMTDFS